jgi:hypothetical protein
MVVHMEVGGSWPEASLGKSARPYLKNKAKGLRYGSSGTVLA